MQPEALIASMLAPEDFGVYYAVGSQKKARGQAIFFEVDPNFRNKELNIEEGFRRCVPHEDGSPKRSIYISVYRVLEHVDLKAVGSLYLTTQDGRTLGIDQSKDVPSNGTGLHLYQELAPVHPLVVSSYGPRDFYDLIVKRPTSLLTLPAICFAELRLGELAENPEFGDVGDLPYANIDHLRQCLTELATKTVHSKMVDRIHSGDIAYRTIKSGLFLGNSKMLIVFWFAFPGRIARKSLQLVAFRQHVTF